MTKRIVMIVVILILSLNIAYADVSPDYLPQVNVSMGEVSDKIIVGRGEDGGVTLVLPSGHKDMVITFTWIEGGVIDFLFYNQSGKIVWDSHDDPHF